MAIIALAISQKSVQLYNENPELYDGYNNLKAGRITAIIGLCLGSLFILFLIIAIISNASFMQNRNIWGDFN